MKNKKFLVPFLSFSLAFTGVSFSGDLSANQDDFVGGVANTNSAISGSLSVHVDAAEKPLLGDVSDAEIIESLNSGIVIDERSNFLWMNLRHSGRLCSGFWKRTG